MLGEHHRRLPVEGVRGSKIAEDYSVTGLVDVGIFIDRIIFQRVDGPEQEAYAEGILVLSIDAFVESQIPAVALAPQHLTRKAHHDLVWDDSPAHAKFDVVAIVSAEPPGNEATEFIVRLPR